VQRAPPRRAAGAPPALRIAPAITERAHGEQDAHTLTKH
jgi:hypothetical protein